MVRRRRYDDIREYDFSQIERQASLLEIAMRDAARRLTPFRPHSDALGDLHRAIHRTLNILRGWPADYQAPHQSLMSPSVPDPRIVLREDGEDDVDITG